METNRKYTKEEVEKAAMLFSKRLGQYPIEINIAVSAIMQNAMKGCPWEVMTSRNATFMRAYKEGRFAQSDKVKAFKLKGMPGKGSSKEQHYLLYSSMDMIIGIMNKESPLGILFTKEDLEMALKRRNEAVSKLVSFLKAGKFGIIGIHNTNDCSEVVVNGVRYPAFSVTLNDLIMYCTMYGYKFILPTPSNKKEKVDPSKASKKIDVVYSLLQRAPSGNALFIEIGK